RSVFLRRPGLGCTVGLSNGSPVGIGGGLPPLPQRNDDWQRRNRGNAGHRYRRLWLTNLRHSTRGYRGCHGDGKQPASAWPGVQDLVVGHPAGGADLAAAAIRELPARAADRHLEFRHSTAHGRCWVVGGGDAAVSFESKRCPP